MSEIIKAIQSSDGILIEAVILGASKKPDLFPHLMQLRKPVSANFLQEVVQRMLAPEVPRILVAADFDLHGPLGGGLTSVEMARFSALAWNYVELPPGASTQNLGNRFDPWMSDGMNPAQNWKDILQSVPCQIEFPHALQPSDLGSRSRHQFWDACVPGAAYATRITAMDSARGQSLKIAPYASLNKLILKATSPVKFGGIRADSFRFKAQALNQRNLIRGSTSCWVDGSGYDYFVRKFLEVPALGTPMVTPTMPMLTRLGFEPGKTHIETTPDEYGQVARFLGANPDVRQEMGRQAKQTVRQFHTWPARLHSLYEAAQAVTTGSRDTWLYKSGKLTPQRQGRSIK